MPGGKDRCLQLEILLIGADEADGLDGALLDAESAFDARVGLDDE